MMTESKDKTGFEQRDAAIERIAAELGVSSQRGRRFAELTSLRVGGSIDWVISPETEEQAAAAEAQNPPDCAPRAKLLDQLSSQYKEVPVAIGLSSSGSLVEVLTSDNGSTWTIMVSQPNGSSCLVAAGEGWQERTRVANNDRGA